MAFKLRLALVLVLIVGACSRAPARSASQAVTPGPYQPPPLITWLDCVECTEAQLRGVAALGDRVVPDLREVLENGPSRDRLEHQARYLQEQYARVKEYERVHPDRAVARTRDDYVGFYMKNYVLRNRARAARALGAIKTPAARAALEEALTKDLPQELLVQVRRALSQ